MTPYVVVAHGEASSVLEVEPDFEKLLSTELWRLVKDQDITSEAPIVTEFEFINKMLSKSACPVAPMVTVLEDQEKKRLSVEGAAVFKHDKMVGELDKKETRGLLWVTGKVETGIFNLEVLGEWAPPRSGSVLQIDRRIPLTRDRHAGGTMISGESAIIGARSSGDP
jgi:spore germination protein KC